MAYKILYITGLLLFYAKVSGGWRAVPANTAMYALEGTRLGFPTPKEHETAPRTYLHSTFKFGWCSNDVLKKQYLRRRANLTIHTWHDAKYAHYVYLLEDKNTQRFKMQCVVMKMYVGMQYVFMKGRLPVYYCQGTVFVVMYDIIQKIELHEFYFHVALSLLAHFEFEFYHPTDLISGDMP